MEPAVEQTLRAFARGRVAHMRRVACELEAEAIDEPDETSRAYIGGLVDKARLVADTAELMLDGGYPIEEPCRVLARFQAEYVAARLTGNWRCFLAPRRDL